MNIDYKTSTIAGRPGLLDSALFPDCVSDSTDRPNRVNWEFKNDIKSLQKSIKSSLSCGYKLTAIIYMSNILLQSNDSCTDNAPNYLQR